MRIGNLGALGALLVAACANGALGAGPLLSGTGVFRDDFDAGLCTGACPQAIWAVRQEVRGRVSAAAAPGRSGKALLAEAEPKAGDEVAKAGLIARTAPMGEGTLLRIGFDLYLPAKTPRNSIQLVDIECASCGEGGNPGIRLYLRRGRLRIDRSKIGIEHAWVRDDAPQLAPDRWHRIEMMVRIDTGEAGAAQVRLDGQEVLAARGATVLPGRAPHADRIQIGVTANSNPVPVSLYIDRVRMQAE